MKSYSDEQLIIKFLKGDEESLEILIKRYLKPIYSFVYRYVGNSQDAQDITQEVFVKVWRNLKKFDKNKKFKSWIFAITKNTCLDWLKKKKAIPFSRFENEKGENKLTETLMDSNPLPDKLFERVGLGEMLKAAINQLALKYRLVLLLRYNGCATFREIAATLSEPLYTVKSRHRRALLQLKKLLSDS